MNAEIEVLSTVVIGKHRYATCRCSCGKVFETRHSSVLSGSTKSCGCLRGDLRKQSYRENGTAPKGNAEALKRRNAQIKEEKAKELIGKKFNFLTVQSVQTPMVTCICDCGNTKVAHRSDVVSGKTSSCGCQRLRLQRENGAEFKSWVGKRFSYLIVKQDLPYHRAIVECDCGTVKEVNKTYLRKGAIKSCGCKSDDMRFETNLAKYGTKTRGVTTSSAEIEILEWLKSLGISAEKGFLPLADGKGRVEIDIMIPHLKIGIEHNGCKWHTENNLSQRKSLIKRPSGKWYHFEKTELAESYGIRLIHIWDYEWKLRKDAIKSYLRSALGKNEIKIPARKTEIRLSDKGEIKSFLEKYHIQGASAGRYHVGIYSNGELVAAAVFSLHHRNSRHLVLSRWCTKENVTVQGGLSKCMKFLKSIVNGEFSKVMSWADRRLSTANGYLASGWKIETSLPPEYFYYHPKTKSVISKQSRSKSNANTPEGMTEAEHAKADGLERVYDCGKIRLVYQLE